MSKTIKRKHTDLDDLESVSRKIKKLEKQLKESCRRPRRRVPVIESSSSSEPSSRDSSPEKEQDGEQSEINVETHDILEILGEDPAAVTASGKDIQKDLASRFEHFATAGISKEARKELCEKYLVPANCILTGAPILNAEIKAALPETVVKRDKAIEARQKQLATAISCLAGAVTEQLNYKIKNQDLLKRLMDTGRLLCDIQYSESITRRNFAVYSLKKDMKEHFTITKIDKYLFGENLPEALKTAKAVSKSGTDLKVPDTKNFKKQLRQSVSKQSSKNWKAPAPARKQPPAPGQQWSREPAAPRGQPARSSKPSPRASTATRRR